MKRVLIVLLLVLIPFFVIAVFLIIDSNQPPPWQPYVTQYLVHQPGNLHIRHSVRAEYPQHFLPEVSFASLGDSLIFTTDYTYTLDLSRAFEGIEDPLTGLLADPRKPLPFPPSELWCISLDSPDSPLTALIFAALHKDLYNADWVIHESDPALTLDQRSSLLLLLGCQ